MKKILSSMFAILFVIGIVSAGIGIGAIAESRDMDKAERDMLLSKTDAGEINPIIEIKCSDDYCIWSASQSGIINSKDNKIQKYYMECLEFNELSQENETYIYNITTYPKKIEEGVLLDKEIDVLRQGLFELNERVKFLEENCIIK